MDMDDIGYRPPSLTVFIKNLLQRYTDGGQILKELLQNADDAGANTVKFAIDSRHHPRNPGGLWRDTLAPFQGPALLAWNNTKFSEKDWKNIGKMQQSMKEEDVLKVGRFGLGFQSVHHITDLPTIVSGQHVAIFDPHEYIIGPDEKNRRQRTAKAFTVKEFCTYPAQVQPFEGVWGFSSCLEEYQGTLFRFPFRTKESNSEISDREYTPEEAENILFKSLAEEAERVLLFLNNVTTVELYHVSHVAFENKDQLLKVEMNPPEAVQTARQWCRTMYSRYGNQPSVGSDSHVCRCTVKVSGPLAVNPGVTCWLLCSTIGAVDENMKDLATKIKVVPAVGLATLIHAACKPQNHTFKDLVVKSCKEIEETVKSSMSPHCAAVQWQDPSSALESNGFAYCFLPMSTTITTGLPVHVHGYFSLSDNRRRVRWPDKDDQGDEATWNRLLMEKLIAPSYAILALARSFLISYRGCDPSVQSMKQNDDPYALLPLVSESKEEPWKYLIQKVLRLFSELPLLWIPIHGGRWVRNSEAYFTHDLMPNACPPDVVNLLLHLDCPIVHLPIKVQQDCHDLIPPIRVLTPQIARDFIRSNIDETVKLLQHDIGLLSSVLTYVTQDGTQDLNNLPLIPVKESGILFSFSWNSSSSIYTHSHDSSIDQVLFGLDGNMLLSESLPGNIQILFGKLGNACQYQLRLANPDIVCSQLLKQSMQIWCSPKGNVQWNVGQLNHPPRQWLSSVWKYVARNRKLTCVLGLPLVTSEGPENLPSSGRVNLYCLTQNSSLVRRNRDQFCSTEVQDIALALHFTIVADSRLYSDCGQELMHILPILSPDTLLNAMQSLSNTRNMVAKLTPTLKRSLREVVTCIPILSIQTINFLQSLSLYEVGVGNRIPTFQSASGQLLFPAKSICFPATMTFPSTVLNVDSQEAETFYRITLRRQPLTRTALVESSIFEFAKVQGTTVRNEILDWIVEESYNDPDLWTFVQTNRCIPNKSNQLCLVSELYDPHDSKLNEYFHQSEAAFPAAVRNRVLVQLQQLGLKNWKSAMVDLAALKAFLLDRAKSVATLARTRGDPDALQRSKIILQEVSNHDRCAELLQYLSDIPFVYCQQLPPSNYISGLKFAGSGHTQLFSLQQLCLQHYSVEYTAHLVGSVCLILSEQYNDCIMRMGMKRVNLHTHDHLSTDFVIQHLKSLILWWCEVGEHCTKKEDFFDLVSKTTSKIYKFLAPPESLVPLTKTEEYYSSLYQSLREVPFIWEDNCFYHADHVFSDEIHVCSPYMVRLSDTRNIRFFRNVGVAEKATIEQLVGALQNMNDTKCDTTLTADEQSFCVHIASRLSSEHIDCNEGLFLPDSNGVMCHHSNLMYMDNRDHTWLRTPEAFRDVTAKILHTDISWKVAKCLGIRNPIQTLLDQYEDNTFLSGLEYGQEENLCDRLTNILRGYHQDTSIFKEFIQNADDAGATEIAFVLDKRKFQATSIFSQHSEWKELQTMPSLLVFNNKKFTDSDIVNITRLGKGGKQDTLETIGRFGIGFNIAYHVTDCPMFVSHGEGGLPENFCVFDPTLIYAPGSRSKSPGRRWDLRKDGNDIAPSFADQLQPFSVETLNLLYKECHEAFAESPNDQKWANGFVMFRLPLTRDGRKQPLNRSPYNFINTSAMSQLDLLCLMEQVVPELSQILLFLNSVRRISFFELSGSDNCNLLGSYCADLAPSDEAVSQSFNCSVLNQIECLKASKQPVCTVQSAYRVPVHGVRTVLTDSVKHTLSTSEEWVVSKRFGGEDLDQNLLHTGLQHGFLPLGGVAARLPTTEQDGNVRLQGKLHCYLPLPLESGVPVHVNGHFWLNDSRRSLQHSKDGSHLLKDWNEAVTNRIIAAAYAELLVYCRTVKTGEMGRFDLSWYYNLFPLPKGPLQNFNLAGSLYALLLSQNAPVLLAMRKYDSEKQQITDPTWLLLTNSTLPQQGLFFTEGEGLNEEILLGLGMNLTAAPTEITCHIRESLGKVYSGIVQPSMVRDHLRSLVPLNTEYLDTIQENVLPLLEFCITDIPDHVTEWAHFLQGVPLMLTEDGVLKPICCVYDGKHTNLLPNCSAHFIHDSIWKSDISSQLETLGIVTKLTKSPEFASKNLCLPRNVGVLDFDPKLKSTLALFWKYLADVDEDNLCLFNSFSVVPTMDRKLYPYSHVKHILLEPPTKTLIRLFNFPVVDFDEILPSSLDSEENHMSDVFESVFAHENVTDVLDLLEHYLNVIVKSIISPKEVDVGDFVRFLEQDGDLNLHGNWEHLRRLPLFKLVSGHLKPIDSFNIAHGIQDLPLGGLEEISSILQDVAFVIVPTYCENFMKNVGIPLWLTWEDKLQFYRDHLVPHFGKLPQTNAPELLQPHILMLLQLFQHFGYFKTTKKMWDPIFSRLSTVPFVKGPRSSICITTLYNPKLEIFKAFLDPNCFPPWPWTQTPGILDFFRHAGMIQAVDTDMWLRFASDFSKEIDQISDHKVLLRKSQLLLSELSSLCSENLYFDTFYANASSIAFVPCKSIVSLQKSLKVALEICDPLFSLPSRKWTSLKGSVVVMKEGEEMLVGLVKSCLDVGRGFTEGRFSSHLDKLGVSYVDAFTVAKNLQCLSVFLLPCQEISTVKIKENVSFLEEVFTNHYKFLNDSNVQSDDVSILHRERCIFLPAEKKGGFMLVAPSDICQDCGSHSDHLQPYIHSAPDSCSLLSHFLTIIGIPKKLTIEQCLKVLTQLQYSTQPLYPNEWRTAEAVYEELVQLCRVLEKQDPGKAVNLPLAVVPLPTSCKKILPASELVLDDASWTTLKRLQSSVVSYPLVHTPPPDDHGYCTLPTCLQVRLLSDVITEHPHEQMLHEANVCNAESVARSENRDHGCNFVIALENNLRCPELQQGILRIIRHESQKVPTDALAASISSMLNTVDVKCVQMIKTVLYNEQGSVIPGSEGGDSACYVPSTSKDGRLFAYIAPHSNTVDSQELVYKLYHDLNGILGHVIKDTVLVMEMLQCIRPEAMPLVLDTFRIPAYDHGTEGQPRESDLGQPVKHFSRLDYIVTCTFRVKEIVKFHSNGNWTNAEIVDVPNVEDVNMAATLQIDCTDEVIQVQLCPLRIAKYVSPQQSLYLKKCWKLPGDSQDSQIAGSAEHQETVSFFQLPIDNLQLLKDRLKDMLQIVETPECEFVCIRLLHHLEFLCAKSGALPNFKRVAEILLSVMLSMNIDQSDVKDLLQKLLNSRQMREHLGSVERGSGGGGGGYSGDRHGDGGSSVHRGRHSGSGSGGGGLATFMNPLWMSRGASRHQGPLWQPTPTVVQPPPQPNLVESKMWLTQSLNDFESAKGQLELSQRYRNNLQGRNGSIILQFPAQVCFLCHDSVEKCLKALFLALYGMSKALTERSNLKDLCDELQSNPYWHKDPPINLLPHVIQVSGHSLNCRYPDYNTPMMEPARVYEQRFEEAQDAVQAVERILTVIRQIATIQQLITEVEYSVIVAAQPPFDANAFPPEWSPHEEGVRLREVPILEDSQEYNSIAELFHSSMGTRSFRIFKIVRIQNQDLWREFSNRRNLLLQQNKPIHDRQLFHGTAGNRPQDIYSSQRGLDIIRSNNGAYGKGIYLAKDAAVSHRYRHTDRGFSQMLVIKTLLGQVDARSRSGPTPTQEVRGGVMEIHDSIQGKLGGSDIFIVHRNDQTYPAYLITYTPS